MCVTLQFVLQLDNTRQHELILKFHLCATNPVGFVSCNICQHKLISVLTRVIIVN